MKTKGWHIIGLFVIVGIGFGLFQGVNVFYPRNVEQDFLVKAFETSGAALVGANINAYASDTNRFLDKTELTEIAKDLTKGMGLDFNNAEKIENFSDDYNQLSVIGRNADGYGMAVIVHSMDFENIDEGPGGFETNIVIDMALDGDIKKLPPMKDKVKILIEKHIQEARITSCIIGSFDGYIAPCDMENIIDLILHSVDGEEVERVLCDNFLSISAYMPHIDDHIQMGENKLNLNIATRYNAYEEKTYIWLGSPVITLEY